MSTDQESPLEPGRSSARRPQPGPETPPQPTGPPEANTAPGSAGGVPAVPPPQAADPSGARRLPRVPPLPAAIAGLLVLTVVAGLIAFGSGAEQDGGGGERRTRAGGPAKDPGKPDPQAARTARRLATLPGLKYTGTFTTKGATVRADLLVTRAGSATGTLTVGGLRAELVSLDGTSYLRGSAEFWRSYGGVTTNPGDYANAWTRAPGQPLDFDIPTLLAPSAIAQRLQTARPHGDVESVAGEPARTVTTPRGDYLVSAADAGRLLRVQAPGGGAAYRFEVTEPVEPAAIFAALRTRVGALGRSRDPRVRFAPGTLRLVNCNNNVSSCSLQLATARQGTAPASSGQPRAMMLGSVSAGGRILGACVGSAAVPASGEVRLRCTVSSRGWRSWMSQAQRTPGRHRYTGHSRVVAVAVAKDEVAGLLAKVDREERGG